MNEDNRNDDHAETQCCGPDGQETSTPTTCCDFETTDTTDACPCGSAMKKHKGAFIGIFALMFLALLISQVGGILGIIAFARTF